MISGSSSKLSFDASSASEDSRSSLASISEVIGDQSDDLREDDFTFVLNNSF